MIDEELINRLGEPADKKIRVTVKKLAKQKRLSSSEFQNLFDSMWKQGPSVKYPNPDGWCKPGETV